MRFRSPRRLTFLVVLLIPAPADAVVPQVAAGRWHSCALTAAGGVRCWGWNPHGQLGDGSVVSRATAVDVVGLTEGVTAISVGEHFTCAVVGRTVKCWGRNEGGQLGDGTRTQRSVPANVVGLTDAVAVSAGKYHACAVTAAGGVRCWGDNDRGELGDGTTTSRAEPRDVVGLSSGVIEVTAGAYHTCALTSGGTVKCWGDNYLSSFPEVNPTPSDVPGTEGGVTHVVAGSYHTCAIMADTTARCWGAGEDGQLGDGNTASRSAAAVEVVGLTGVTSLAAGHWHTCALAGGAVSCWGLDPESYLDGASIRRLTPVPVAGLSTGVAALAESRMAYHDFAFMVDGRVLGWGAAGCGFGGFATGPGALIALAPILVKNFGVRANDVDGDARSDIVWRHATTGELWLWSMNGTTYRQTYAATVLPEWEIQGTGDQDGDWKSDLLWRHRDTGELYLWRMEGASIRSVDYVAAVDPRYVIVGHGDYNGDGRADILWQHAWDGDVWLWLMDGATVTAVQCLAMVLPAYRVRGSVDFDGDGQADILWQHAAEGEVWVWLMNGTAARRMTFVGALEDPSYQVAGVGDYDGDGKGDILWMHPTTLQTWLVTMDGDAITSQRRVAPTPAADSSYEMVGTSDYDGDWLGDALWYQASTGDVWLTPGSGWTGSSLAYFFVSNVTDRDYQIVTWP